MTKADIVNEVSKNTGIEKVTVQKTVEAFMETVKDSLVKDRNVYLRGFGSFKVKSRNPRKARNPRTGASVDVPAKLVPYFKASNELKIKVNR